MGRRVEWGKGVTCQPQDHLVPAWPTGAQGNKKSPFERREALPAPVWFLGALLWVLLPFFCTFAMSPWSLLPPLPPPACSEIWLS